MPEEITFQNAPVDPSLEFRNRHIRFFVAERAERIDPERAGPAREWRP
jgi:hypothetical protein